MGNLQKEVLANDQPKKEKRDALHKNQLTKVFERFPEDSLMYHMRRSFLAMAVALILIGCLATGPLIYANSATSYLLNQLEPALSYNNDMLVQVLEMNADVHNYLRTGNDSYLTSYQSDGQSYKNLFQSTSNLQLSDARAARLFTLENSAAQSLFTVYQQSALAIPPSELTQQRIAQVIPNLDQHLQSYQSRFNAANLLLTSERKSAQHRINILTFITTIATIAAVLVALVLGFRRALIARLGIQGFLDRLTDTLSRLGAGEAQVRAPLTGLLEERVLAGAINSMAEQKESLIIELEREYEQERGLREGLELERTIREGLSTTLYRDLDVKSAVQRTVNGLGPALHADRALVRIIENGTPDTIISEWLSPTVNTPMDRKIGDIPVGHLRTSVFLQPGPIRDSIRNGSVVFVNDVSSDERLSRDTRETLLKTGLGAFISASVIGTEGPEAVLLATMEGRARNWTDRDIQVSQAMANGLAATLTAIRLYEQERTNLTALKKLDESKDVFLATVSHELRTPLTSIVGYLELLQDEIGEGKIPRTYSRMLDAIDRNSKRLLDLIDNILTASRIESGKLELSKTRTHVTPVLARVAETIMPQVKSKHIDLKINIDEGIPNLEIDTRLIERAILNVLSNATKFTPDGGTVSITVFKQAGSVALSVTDSGMGIEPDELKNLFTKFHRTAAARDKAIQGTGLGLVIVKAIIEQHGGSVSVTSKVGEGTTFTILLPWTDSNSIQENIEAVADSRTAQH